MGIADIFSKRNKPVPAGDVLAYDVLPQPLRIQIFHILNDSLGRGNDDEPYGQRGFSSLMWETVTNTLARELGKVTLVNQESGLRAAFTYLINTDAPVENHIDLIEMGFKMVDKVVRKKMNEEGSYRYGSSTLERSGINQPPDSAIEELNHRFLEHGVGYQYAGGIIIRVDNTFTHAEIIKPALSLIANKTFVNAQKEFLQAHEHYRHGRYAESLNESLKAFESTMKIICQEMKWPYNPTDPAKRLIETVLSNGLINASLQEQLTSLRILLESGTPTVRNKTAAHGQGATQVSVPEHIAAYGLHTSAANIVLLVSAFQARKAGKP